MPRPASGSPASFGDLLAAGQDHEPVDRRACLGSRCNGHPSLLRRTPVGRLSGVRAARPTSARLAGWSCRRKGLGRGFLRVDRPGERILHGANSAQRRLEPFFAEGPFRGRPPWCSFPRPSSPRSPRPARPRSSCAPAQSGRRRIASNTEAPRSRQRIIGTNEAVAHRYLIGPRVASGAPRPRFPSSGIATAAVAIPIAATIAILTGGTAWRRALAKVGSGGGSRLRTCPHHPPRGAVPSTWHGADAWRRSGRIRLFCSSRVLDPAEWP